MASKTAPKTRQEPSDLPPGWARWRDGSNATTSAAPVACEGVLGVLNLDRESIPFQKLPSGASADPASHPENKKNKKIQTTRLQDGPRWLSRRLQDGLDGLQDGQDGLQDG